MTSPRVLYIASAGVSDPLIVSQVLRYLERLRPSLSACHLITFERDRGSVSEFTRHSLEQSGIIWHPVTAWPRFRTVGFCVDYWNALKTARSVVRKAGIEIVHCRSFLAGTLGRKLQRAGVRFLYDMRGFWSLEKRDKGTIRHPWMFNLAWNTEQQLFHDADHMVSLTEAGKQKLIRDGVRTPIDVIPTCVDLESFRPATNPAAGRPEPDERRLISVGTLGAGYLPAEQFQFCRQLQERWGDCSIRVLTGSDENAVRAAAAAAGVPQGTLTLDRVPPSSIPGELAEADIGLCFVRPAEAKAASCPTQLGEYLACGIPVVATDGIGDVTQILEDHRIGVVLQHDQPRSWHWAIDRLEDLLTDEHIHERCRTVAVERLGLEAGIRDYLGIYHQLTDSQSLRTGIAA